MRLDVQSWGIKTNTLICLRLAAHLSLDLLVQAGGLKTGRVYTGSVKYRSGVFRIQIKYRSDVFQFLGFWINSTGLDRLFLGYFFFCQNKKNSPDLELKIIHIQWKSIQIVIC